MMAAGFPHSDTAGSSLPYSSPTLFAVWRVLLHSGVARHPPYALPYLISGSLLTSRVFFEMFHTYKELFFNCFSLKILVYNFRLDLFCYVFFMLFSFQRSILSSLFRDPSKLNKSIACSGFHRSMSLIRKLLITTLFLLRKEVIHPHVPVGIPCYDFTPIISPTLDSSLLAVGPPASGVTNSHGVTGGVYKARERIHRDMLIRDY